MVIDLQISFHSIASQPVILFLHILRINQVCCSRIRLDPSYTKCSLYTALGGCSWFVVRLLFISNISKSNIQRQVKFFVTKSPVATFIHEMQLHVVHWYAALLPPYLLNYLHRAAFQDMARRAGTQCRWGTLWTDILPRASFCGRRSTPSGSFSGGILGEPSHQWSPNSWSKAHPCCGQPWREEANKDI